MMKEGGLKMKNTMNEIELMEVGGTVGNYREET